MISVIMSVYNERKEWLKESIESILNQTLRNFEFIIILDNPENYILKQVIEDYSKQDKRIQFFINEKNMGLTASLNFALKKAKGKYIARMDADDISELNRLEKQYNYMLTHEVDLFGSNIIEFNENCQKKTNIYTKDIDIRKNILNGNFIPHPTWFCKREVYEHLNGYRDIPTCEDYDFILRALKYGFTIENMNDCTLKYRLSQNSISRSGLLKQRLTSVYLAKNFEIIDSITKNDIEEYLTKNIKNSRQEKNYAKTCRYIYEFHAEKKKIKKLKKLFQAFICSITYFKLNHTKVKTKLKRNKDDCCQLCILYKFYLKMFVFSLIKKYKFFDTNKCKNKRIILLDVPQYKNLGDHAIAYAERKFFEKNFPEYKIYEVSIDLFEKVYWDLKKNIQPDDVLVLIGGGNLGIEYYILELHRRKIVQHFNNKIFLFPQTIYFGFSDYGLKQFEKTIHIYSKNKKLTLMAREQYSYKIMKENFENSVYLVPDIVLSLNKSKNIECQNKSNILLCMRNDIEKTISKEFYEKIYLFAKKIAPVFIYDTVLENCILQSKRDDELEKCFKLFCNSKFVITDRLHGMIFAYITKTPCIVFGNYNYKVRGVYETWFSQTNNFYYCKNMDQYMKYVNQINSQLEFNFSNFDSEFEELYYLLRRKGV